MTADPIKRTASNFVSFYRIVHQPTIMSLLKSMGAPPVPDSIRAAFRSEFERTLILSGGHDAARAERDPESGQCDPVAFARPFLANPDPIAQSETRPDTNARDAATFYTPGPNGHTDHTTLREPALQSVR